jgi:hypothetical protein
VRLPGPQEAHLTREEMSEKADHDYQRVLEESVTYHKSCGPPLDAQDTDFFLKNCGVKVRLCRIRLLVCPSVRSSVCLICPILGNPPTYYRSFLLYDH